MQFRWMFITNTLSRFIFRMKEWLQDFEHFDVSYGQLILEALGFTVDDGEEEEEEGVQEEEVDEDNEKQEKAKRRRNSPWPT